MALHLMLIVVGLTRSVSGDSSLTPLETMADVTNDFGICVLQLLASPDANTVFSPYGLVSMAVLVYEGSVGQSAAEIFNTLHLPWHRDILRIGIRDLHRYLRSYFSSEGFLKGLVFSKPNVVLRPGYVEVLQFYGFHLDSGTVFKPITEPYPGGDGGNITFTTEFPDTTTIEPLEVTTELPAMETNETMTDIPSNNGTIQVTTMTETETSMTTDKQPTPPDGETMKGPETTTSLPTTQQDQQTQTPTTVLPTVTGETTKNGELDTTPALADAETTEALKTTTELRMAENKATTEPIRDTTKMETTTTSGPQETEVAQTQRTTRDMDMTTEELTTMVSSAITTIDINSVITESPNKTDVQETTTATSTEGVDVVTITNGAAPSLEVMNMMLHTTYKTEQTVGNDVSIEVSTLKATDPTETTIVSSDQDEPTEEFTEAVAVSTVMVDTEVLVLTTPPEGEEEGEAMLEAFILLEDESLRTTTDSSLSKRPTKRPGVEEKESQTENLLGVKVPLRPPLKDNLVNEVTPGSAVSNTEPSVGPTSGATFNTGEKDAGFPTLEPDKIVFPTIMEPRLPRSVKVAGWEPLGNWVVPPEWRRQPSHLWFRTPSGDRLVPALAHLARLPFVELPALHASALQLPLDDERYSLLLLLPQQPLGLKQMLYQLQWHSLRSVLRGCRLTAVQAVLPAFTVAKRVDLTAPLYKLGIRHVFEYRAANLTDLSPVPHLFVRAVEQHITVSVRKFYPAPWADTTVGEVQREFLVSHPFAYFIVDRETAVALVAGTVVDPLQRDPPS